jgi:hypothetical protein
MNTETSNRLGGLDTDLCFRIAQGRGIAGLHPKAANQLLFCTRLGFQSSHFDLVSPTFETLAKLISILGRG